ncbi:uncharacterized [Tachysurus ichikawai]
MKKKENEERKFRAGKLIVTFISGMYNHGMRTRGVKSQLRVRTIHITARSRHSHGRFRNTGMSSVDEKQGSSLLLSGSPTLVPPYPVSLANHVSSPAFSSFLCSFNY